MRLHSVTLRNFRGVTEQTVDFADSGITVVEGDNGTGKTSLMQAVDLIFRYPDSSRAQPIDDIKPEGRDVGTEIELTATLGQYRLTYEKKYHRNKSTRLQVHEPVSEMHTGREAHDRAAELFESNVDVPLFRALWFQQGVELHQADLSEQTSLGAALDSVAGEPVDSESETTLFQRVREEYERYFTGKGQTNIALKRLIEEHESAVETVEDLESQLRALEEKVEMVASLSQKISELHVTQTEQAERVNSLATKWQEIEKSVQQVESLRLEAELAASNCERANSGLNARKQLTEAVNTATRKRDDLASKLEALAPGISTVQTAYDTTRSELDKARGTSDEGQALLRLRQADFEYRRDEFDIRTMTERQDRVKEAHAALREAEKILSSCRIDSQKLADIEEAHTTALTIRARLEGESAHFELEAFSPQEMDVGDERIELSTGEQLRRTVERELILELPDVMRITVTSGQGSESLAETLRTADAVLSNKLHAAEAADVSDARTIYRRRVDAERNVENSEKSLEDDLRDLTPEQLSDRIGDLTQKTDHYTSERISSESLPEDLDAARLVRDATVTEAQSRQTNFERTTRDFEGAEKNLNAAKKDGTELGVELRVAQGRLDDAMAALSEARTAEADETIAERVRKLENFTNKASGVQHEAASKLAESNPDAVKVEFETARGVAVRIDRQVANFEDQVRDARSYLSVKGEVGLHEKLMAEITART